MEREPNFPSRLRLRDDVILLHCREHQVHALGRAVRIRERIVAPGILRESRQKRDLIQSEPIDGLAEVLPGGRLDAVRSLAEVDLVEVHLEDLMLRIGPLDLEGKEHLLDLSREGLLLLVEEEVCR
jgi:hypothetical protein